MILSQLPKLKGVTKEKKRVGRGIGSGKGGHTTGRGNKGQKIRYAIRPGFEGGQNPIYKSLPQARGFKAIKKPVIAAINLRDLERKFNDGDLVTIESIKSSGLVAKKLTHVKVLGNGEITKKIRLSGVPVSESAKAKIEKAGGSVE